MSNMGGIFFINIVYFTHGKLNFSVDLSPLDDAHQNGCNGESIRHAIAIQQRTKQANKTDERERLTQTDASS